jgi:thiamine-phosphate pyrophosphorylase
LIGSWRRERLADVWLYLCMDRRADRGDLDGFLDTVLGAGIDQVQLRDKTATRDELAAASAVFRAAADRHGALFILNDDPYLAAEVGADGVHVGQDDLHPSDARLLVGPDAIVGRSTHSLAEVDGALAEDCDYFAIGPVHATPTKQGRPAIGLEPLRHAAAAAQGRPWFVTGAMRLETAPEVLATGARRLVVVRAITDAPDPARVVSDLAALLRR